MTVDKRKRFWKSTKIRQGSYSAGLTVIVLAIVIVANLVVEKLPEHIRNIDVSDTNLYEVSDISREMLSDLQDDVTFTVLAEKESTDERISTFLSKYAGLSKHISVKWIDPVLHPSALTEYDTSENTIVVTNETTQKSTTVAFADMIVIDYSSYYYTGTYSESGFDAEGQLTSAVNYVTNEADETIYLTSGHGEASFSETISGLMKKNNYSVSEINLLMDAQIPKDCDLLLLNAPMTDLAEVELECIRTYLAEGGKVMLLLGDTVGTDLTNLKTLLADYGMEIADGYIADMGRSYQGNPYYIFPELNVSGDMAQGISTDMVLLVYAQGLNLTDAARDTIQINEFMTTGRDAYAVTETDQKEGTYTLGAVATETVSVQSDEGEEPEESDKGEVSEESGEGEVSEESGEGEELEDRANDVDAIDASDDVKTGRFTVISSSALIDPQITDTFSSLENTTLFMNAVTANFEGVKNLSIEPKSLAVEYNTVQHAGLLSLFVVIGIPAILLIGGIVVWVKRRKA